MYYLIITQVIIVVSKTVTGEGHNQSRGRRSKGPPPTILQQVFHMVNLLT